MSIHVKVFPIAGVCDAAQVMDVTLNEGCLSELMTILTRQLGTDPRKQGIMILNNGQSLDVDADASLNDGDNLWVMPRLSGG